MGIRQWYISNTGQSPYFDASALGLLNHLTVLFFSQTTELPVLTVMYYCLDLEIKNFQDISSWFNTIFISTVPDNINVMTIRKYSKDGYNNNNIFILT